MANNRWLKNAGKKTVSTRKKSDKSKIFDKIPSLNKVIYAYKIYNNTSNPTIRTNGHSFIKLIEETKFEKVDFTISGLKSSILDSDDGAKTSGKYIGKYKTLSILNFDATVMGEFDLFSPVPLVTGERITIDTPDIFTYEEGDSINEIDPITNVRTDSTDESVSLISFNSLAKLSTEVVEIELYASIAQIPEFNPGYKLNKLKIEADVNFGLNRIYARGRVANINKFFNLKLDDDSENKFMIVKSFTTDEDMFDSYEPYFDPSVTMFWEEQHLFLNESNITTIFDVTTAIGKAQYDLVIGAHALSWLLKNNFEGITRDDQGILNQTCRGVSLANLDRASNKSTVMEDAIDYWLQFLPFKSDKNKALRVLAALSNGIVNNKYVFPGDTTAVNVPWHLESNNLYTADWIDRSQYPTFNVKTVHNIYTVDANGDINGLQTKWKELSRIKYIETGVNEVSLDFLDSKAQKNDYSPYPGENDTKDVAKDFVLYAVPSWSNIQDIFSEKTVVLYPAGTEKDFNQLSTIRSTKDLFNDDFIGGIIHYIIGKNLKDKDEAMDLIFKIVYDNAIKTIKAPLNWTRVNINSELLEIDGLPKGDEFKIKWDDILKEIINTSSTSTAVIVLTYGKLFSLLKGKVYSVQLTTNIKYKADIDIIANNSKNTYITDEEIITDRQLALFGVNKFEFEVVLDESTWTPGTVLTSMAIKNKYGTEIKITKEYEFTNDEGNTETGTKEYIVKLGSSMSPENQLTEIGFGV